MFGIQIEAMPYDDDPLHLSISAGNSRYAGHLSIYDQAEAFETFGEQLMAFPRSISDEVTYEAGQDDDAWAYYLRFRAALVSRTGQAGLFVRMRSNGDPQIQAVSEFCIRCDPADLNRLGAALSKWSKEPFEVLQWSVRA